MSSQAHSPGLISLLHPPSPHSQPPPASLTCQTPRASPRIPLSSLHLMRLPSPLHRCRTTRVPHSLAHLHQPPSSPFPHLLTHPLAPPSSPPPQPHRKSPHSTLTSLHSPTLLLISLLPVHFLLNLHSPSHLATGHPSLPLHPSISNNLSQTTTFSPSTCSQPPSLRLHRDRPSVHHELSHLTPAFSPPHIRTTTLPVTVEPIV
ncbi:unnamed protein product [Sphenostylis stenocarpa]|uniref:Uncharacterized protein n=1 Tax=Sphenostylis stenocarpa TaxID=92480 RepID=A0AA86VBB9_9FABA|nr:unnamed protein product [Sphenostylis stenocarpa]